MRMFHKLVLLLLNLLIHHSSPLTVTDLSSILPLPPLLQQKLAHHSSVIVTTNKLVNLVSRNPPVTPLQVFKRHTLPSLALIPKLPPSNKLRIADVGSGGGFPGLPMAIALPQHHFTLIDSVGKKLSAAHNISVACELDNVAVWHGRAEKYDGGAFDVVMGRSVCELRQFCKWVVDGNLLREDGVVLYIRGGAVNVSMGEIGSSIDGLMEEFAGSEARAALLSVDDNPKSLHEYDYSSVLRLAKEYKKPAKGKKKSKAKEAKKSK